MGRHDERWTIGETRLTSLVEAETMGVPVQLFYPEATGSDVADATWMDPALGGPDGISFRVQSFVLEHRGLTVVVDPCVGNGKHLFELVGDENNGVIRARQLPHQLQESI